MSREKTKISLPFEVSESLKAIGNNLRTARLRRNLTIDDVAGRVGVHRETLSLAEKGSPNVAIGTYIAALWVYGLVQEATHLAAPERDQEGIALEAASSRTRARPGMGGLSDDF